ncbi:unnamed protein product [Prunus armeniaca]
MESSMLDQLHTWLSVTSQMAHACEEKKQPSEFDPYPLANSYDSNLPEKVRNFLLLGKRTRLGAYL